MVYLSDQLSKSWLHILSQFLAQACLLQLTLQKAYVVYFCMYCIKKDTECRKVVLRVAHPALSPSLIITRHRYIGVKKFARTDLNRKFRADQSHIFILGDQQTLLYLARAPFGYLPLSVFLA